jgi:hypothetical protein
VPRYESYLAGADAQRARILADTPSPFMIEIRFIGGLTDAQQAAFAAAADRWASVIVGDLPEVSVDGEDIDDVLILAEGSAIDGAGRILGQAGPTHLRPVEAGTAAYLPAKGLMSFDSADLAEMEAQGTLGDVITHEMGHVLGIGTVWRLKHLLADEATANPTFGGATAMDEYARLRGAAAGIAVPVENTGGAGTRGGHWREAVFRHELMSGFIAGPDNPLSRITVASLADLGYTVDLEAAEPYQLPEPVDVAEPDGLVPHAAPLGVGYVLPVVPQVLDANTLIEDE